ncbi:MAG: hypothetical protein AB7P16_28430 [Bradyrhizobium sp.]|uniref:hypothetical protein n=1 Tax=Bradyrhizobium sp. TaxID=376 RepID=UPI003D0EB161
MTEQQPRGAFSRFIFPDSEITLKAVFDNLRNYAIAASLFAIAAHTNVPDHAGALSRSVFIGKLLLGGLGAAALVLNLAQSHTLLWRIHSRVTKASFACFGRSRVGFHLVFFVLLNLWITLEFSFGILVVFGAYWVMKIA